MDGKSRPCVDNTSPGLVSTGGGGVLRFHCAVSPMATVWAGYGAVGSGAQLEEVALWEAGLEVCC